jgi:hypothetical protein
MSEDVNLDFREARYPVKMGVTLTKVQAKRVERYCRRAGKRPPEVMRDLIECHLPDVEGEATTAPRDEGSVEESKNGQTRHF